MNLPMIILALIGAATAFGALALFFKKGGDKEASELDKNTIRAYRDSEAKLQLENAALKLQIQTKDDIIERLLRDGKNSKKSSR